MRRLFLGLIFAFVLVFPVNDGFALRQMAGIPEVTVHPGGAEEFTWGLVSDDDTENTIVNLRAEGDGAEFLIYPESVTLEPRATQYVPIRVQVPDNHDGTVTSYSPSLYATEFGEKDGAVVINVSMEKKINITIREPPGDAPENVVADMEQQQQRMQESNSEDMGGGGCLVATAVYGTELAPQIQMLREIRDDRLMQTESGRSFMESFNMFYYSFSPVVADYQRENDSFNGMIQLLITPMISSLSIMEYAESELQVVILGIGVIALNGLLYGVMPAAAVLFTRKVLQK